MLVPPAERAQCLSAPRDIESLRSDEARAQLSDEKLSQFLAAQNDAALKILSHKGIAVLQLSHAGVLSDPADAVRSIGHFLASLTNRPYAS